MIWVAASSFRSRQISMNSFHVRKMRIMVRIRNMPFEFEDVIHDKND